MRKDRFRAWIPVLVLLGTGLAFPAPAAAQTYIERESLTPNPGLPLKPDDAEIAARIQKYWNLLEKHPYDASLHINLGNLYAMWGDNSEAMVEYNKAIGLNPKSSVALTNLGTLYTAMGKQRKAFKAFKKALAVDPNAALAFYNLGSLYEQKGDYDKSVEYYKRAVDLKPALANIATNPRAVHNIPLEIVLLMKYQEQAGRHALPLHWIPLPETEEPAAPDAPDAP